MRKRAPVQREGWGTGAPGENLAIEQVLELLESNPRRLAGLTVGLSKQRLHAKPGAEQWSLNEVLAHLRSCSDVWGDCMQRMIEENTPTIRIVSPRTWIRRTDYPDLDFASSFRAYRRQRAALLSLLRPLPARAWTRSATMVGIRVPKRDVLFYARWLASHERSHVMHVERILKGRAASQK